VAPQSAANPRPYGACRGGALAPKVPHEGTELTLYEESLMSRKRSSGTTRVHATGRGALDGQVGGFSFAAAGEATTWLIKYLSDRGIHPAPGSPLERAALLTWEAAERSLIGAYALSRREEHEDVRDRLADLVGLTELAFAVRRVRKHANAQSLNEHLALLGQASGTRAGPEVSQSIRPDVARSAAHLDPGADKLFELLVACFAMEIGSDVQLDPPTSADGTNPDVLMTFKGRRWGFACKALHTEQPQTLASHLRNGTEQIKASEAERGVVLVSLRTRVRPAAAWPAGEDAEGKWLAAWDSMDQASTALISEGQRYTTSLASNAGVASVNEIFLDAKPVAGWAYYLSSVTAVRGVVPTSIRMFNFVPLASFKEPASRELDALAALNASAQLVFSVPDPSTPTVQT
jgi:hypothetical protein